MSIKTTTPQFGGDIGAFIARQDLTAHPDPATPVASTFAAVGADPANVYVPLDFLNIPNVSPEAEMDSVHGIGSYVRLQRNLTSVKPTLRFRQMVRSIALLKAGVRNSDGSLNYYSILTGNSYYARQAFGAKVESMDIEIPLDGGPVTVAVGMQAIYAGRTDPATAAIPAMGNGDLTLPVYYGYNAALTFGADDYTDYIKKVRISIKNEIERLPPKRITLSLPGGPVKVLVSRHLKEKTQVTGVTFELYEALPIGDVAVICRSNPTVAVALTDDCHPGRGIGISLPDLSFGSDAQDEGDATSIVSFSAAADARSFVFTETQPT